MSVTIIYADCLSLEVGLLKPDIQNYVEAQKLMKQLKKECPRKRFRIVPTEMAQKICDSTKKELEDLRACEEIGGVYINPVEGRVL